MRLPVIRGVIDRRILVNYRVDPAVLVPLLPVPFRPKLVRGFGLVGICLIRLKHLRPTFLPSWMGVSSENAAHRTAVEWDVNGATRSGVYVRRRDTNSWLNTLAGGRLFPGFHHHASFDVRESAEDLAVTMRSDDNETSLRVHGRLTTKWSPTSIFSSLAEASGFFEAGAMGYSATPVASRFQGLELRCSNWHVDPLEVEEVRSNFFDNESLFPKCSIEFDCALLMQNIAHEWHEQADLCCAAA